MINPKPQSEHQYKRRSCLNCDLFLSKKCHAYDEHQQPFMFSNKAKYGCQLYRGEYLNEKPKKEMKRITKKR